MDHFGGPDSQILNDSRSNPDRGPRNRPILGSKMVTPGDPNRVHDPGGQMASNGIPQSAYALAMAPWAIHGQSTESDGARDPKYPIWTTQNGSKMGDFRVPNPKSEM